MGQVLVRLIEMHGIDATALLREAGVDPATLRDPGARLSSETADHLLSRAAAGISDPAFALRAARCWHPSNLGALGHAWLTSSTLRTGLRRLERYNRILSEKATYRLEESLKGLRMVFDHGRRDIALAAPGVDFAFSL